MAQVFLQEGYVDALLSGDEVEARVTEIVDAVDDDGDVALVGLRRYLIDIRQPSDETLATIAVVPVEGTLIPGESIQGSAGSETIVNQLTEAMESDAVAIVLRINSGGGSVFASEEIRTKVQEISEAGVPVVSSMGAPRHRADIGLRLRQIKFGRCRPPLPAALAPFLFFQRSRAYSTISVLVLMALERRIWPVDLIQHSPWMKTRVVFSKR